MSSTIFCERLDAIKMSKDYPKELISQIETIILENNNKLPKEFELNGFGRHTISKLLRQLGYERFSIYAPEGSNSSSRLIILN